MKIGNLIKENQQNKMKPKKCRHMKIVPWQWRYHDAASQILFGFLLNHFEKRNRYDSSLIYSFSMYNSSNKKSYTQPLDQSNESLNPQIIYVYIWTNYYEFIQ